MGTDLPGGFTIELARRRKEIYAMGEDITASLDDLTDSIKAANSDLSEAVNRMASELAQINKWLANIDQELYQIGVVK